MKKNTYIKGFFAIVAVLAAVRFGFKIGGNDIGADSPSETTTASTVSPDNPENPQNPENPDNPDNPENPQNPGNPDNPENPALPRNPLPSTTTPHPIYSVPSFKNTFPDMNDVQMAAATKHGVSPVKNREEAEKRMKELVYVGASPYFHIDKLNSSIPYLVPKAALLLHDIGAAFFDSLYVKGIPLHKIIVTSVMRTKDDVVKLRNRNQNATENSCHLYGTTIDVCYNRYMTIEDPEGPRRRAVRNDTLKWVLSEVLRDFRQDNRCLIKYEVKQGCFHMTVK